MAMGVEDTGGWVSASERGSDRETGFGRTSVDLGSSTNMMGVRRENVTHILEPPMNDRTCSRSLQWGQV